MAKPIQVQHLQFIEHLLKYQLGSKTETRHSAWIVKFIII